MNKIKQYFKPFDKGNLEGFTFSNYISRNMLVPLIINSLVFIISLTTFLFTESEDKNVFLGVSIFSFFVLSVIVVGSIYTWGQLKTRMNK